MPDPPAPTGLIDTEGVSEFVSMFDGLVLQAQGLLTQLTRPWALYQLGIALALFAVAHLLRGWAQPRMREWLSKKTDWPRWRLKLLLVVMNRLRGIFFAGLIWATVFAMRELTWPSRSYLLTIVANLSMAWLIVVFATRLIRNPIMRQVVRYGAWTWITLRILGVWDEVVSVLDGIALDAGEMRISLWLVLRALVLIGLFFVAARFLSKTTGERIRRNEDISPSMQVLAVKLLQLLLYGGAFVIGLRMVGVDLTGLAFLSGAIGIGLGFGLQKVVSNLVSGVIILLDKSIKPGDVITVGQTFGWINSLGARYVSITTRDGREYLIPNEDLITTQVVNWSHSNDFVRLDIYFGTAYGDDPHVVRKLAINAAKSVDRVLSFRPPVCHIVGFGDSSVDYILRFWIKDPTGGLTNIRGNVYLALWDAFKENGISIPFPQREVKVLEGSELGHKALD